MTTTKLYEAQNINNDIQIIEGLVRGFKTKLTELKDNNKSYGCSMTDELANELKSAEVKGVELTIKKTEAILLRKKAEFAKI